MNSVKLLEDAINKEVIKTLIETANTNLNYQELRLELLNFEFIEHCVDTYQKDNVIITFLEDEYFKFEVITDDLEIEITKKLKSNFSEFFKLNKEFFTNKFIKYLNL